MTSEQWDHLIAPGGAAHENHTRVWGVILDFLRKRKWPEQALAVVSEISALGPEDISTEQGDVLVKVGRAVLASATGNSSRAG